jgi:3-phenylpropionate/trans-cinnamate dioxygenase ferredoxin reductase subunit
LRRIAIVGASLAGLRAAEGLRRRGYDGALALVGAEARLPYDRPPLSKEILQGTWGPERTALCKPAAWEALALELHLGRRATALDPAAREVALDSGERIAFDGLVIATGAAPRALRGAAPRSGVHLLRTLDDALAIRDALAKGPRVAVVGAGFIGAEVAASCRARGLEVAVIEALPVPLARGLGTRMGEVCAALHRDHGVDLRCGVGVAVLEGAERVERVRLSDGSAIAADLVVVGIGVAPETEWLSGSGLAIDDGVVCDATCTAAPGIVAAGDVARWWNPLFEESMRVEHWTNAVEQGDAAAATLLAAPGSAPAFAPVPYFWSDQYDVKIQFAGRAQAEDDVHVVHGSLEERRFVALYARDGRVTGALAFSRPRLLVAYRRLLLERPTLDTALAFAKAQES